MEEVNDERIEPADEAAPLLQRIESLPYSGGSPHPLTLAVREHADLIDREAPPKSFLQVHDNNVSASIDRMVAYWDARTNMLGDDLALSPAREILDFGSLKSEPRQSMILPFDKFSRSILYVSTSAETGKIDKKELFCHSQLASENPVSQVDGVVVVHNLENSSTEDDEEVARFLSNSIASKLKRYFLVCPQNQPSLTSTKIPQLTRILSLASLPIKPVVVIGSSASDIQCQLEQQGLAGKYLPPAIGGTFSALDVQAWLNKHSDAPFVPASRWAAIVSLVKNTVSTYIGVKEPSTSDANTLNDAKRAPEEAEVSCPVGLSKEALQNDPERALTQIEEAMEFVCEQDKLAFLEAKTKARHLILVESNPLWYLQLENYNVWAAARRIGCYWRFRIFAFGDRAFVPLALHSKVDSAMGSEEKVLFETGFLAIGPPDNSGRTVVFFNRARFAGTEYERDQYRKARCRCFIFAMQLASEIDASRDEGVVFVSDFGTHQNQGSQNDEEGRSCVKAIQMGAFPILIKQSHLIVRPGKHIVTRILLNAVYPIVDGWNHFMNLTLLHIQSDRMELLSILKKHGFEKEGLYHALGGTWSFKKDFKLWLEYRIYCESVKFGIVDKKDISKQGDTLSFSEFRKSQKRKMDVLYARRKRQRYKIEVDVLDSRADEYRKQNASLKVKNAHLEGLLKDARLLESRILQSPSLGGSNFAPSRNEHLMFSARPEQRGFQYP